MESIEKVPQRRKKTHILVSESSQDFDFSQCSLTKRLMFERRNFFDRNFGLRFVVKGRTVGDFVVEKMRLVKISRETK